MVTQQLEIEYIPIGELTPCPQNPRKNADNVPSVAKSIDAFGWTNPILARREDNMVVAGHTRLKAAIGRGMTEVPVIYLDLDPTDAKAYMLADNKLTENVEWDGLKLAEIFAELDQLNVDLDLTGFSTDEINNYVLGPTDMPGLTDEDDVPDVEDATVKLGDLWILGEHRLLCGDSTKQEDVVRLMDGEKADICFTSPPYNVGRTPNGNEKKYLIDNDNKKQSVYLELLVDSTELAMNEATYVFYNIQHLAGNKIALIEYLYNFRNKLAETFIWDKLTAEPAMGENICNSQFEYVFCFSSEGKRRIGTIPFRGTLTNILGLNSRQDKQNSNIHKATYPVSFVSHFVESFAKYSVLDLFLGSGSTLIACEKTNRKCYGMEIDPHYCDVIIKRWEDYTGETAVLDG